MSEIGDFINNWGTLLRNLILIAGILGGLFRLLRTLDRINENIERIPEMRVDLEDLRTKIENILGVQKNVQNETKTMRSDMQDVQSNVKNMQTDIQTLRTHMTALQGGLQTLQNDLQQHCINGKRKDRLTLDMSRQMLLNEIEAAIHLKCASINKKTVLSELYESYRADGGNGTIQALWATYLALPTEAPKNTKPEGNKVE